MTTPIIIIIAVFVLSCGLYLWSGSTFITFVIIGGLSLGVLVGFVASPVFVLTDYWVLIPILVVSTIGSIISMSPLMEATGDIKEKEKVK